VRFWDLQQGKPDAVALVDEAGRGVSYGELDRRVGAAAHALRERGERCMGILRSSNSAATVVTYLACLRAGQVPLLLPAAVDESSKEALLRLYEPEWVAGPNEPGDTLAGAGLPFCWRSSHAGAAPLHPDLGLLLSTSGTTGSARLVRLSYAAVQANARSIAHFLELGPAERAITTLPAHYSYGLSIINSHLHAGACVVLTEHGVLRREFWDQMEAWGVTSLAGVPYVYQLLQRTGFFERELPAMRTLTQAGGRLDDRLMRSFHEVATRRGWRFFVMYGQTEATARISYVPVERLGEKIGSIGVAIPDGQLSLDACTGEIIYRGPNVMMGYATERADLARGDDVRGMLRTGELGHVDADGYFYLDGRLKRFVKLSGNRIGLDEVEDMLQRELGVPVSVGGRDDMLVAWMETADEALVAGAGALLKGRYGLHHSLFRIQRVGQLPLLASGKKNYAPLLETA
jgi:long-chain acyl-CoA synthetase